jgi:hypothetical protein
VNSKERRAAVERQARTRTVHGWAFKDLPDEEVAAIRAFLDGGPCPEGYKHTYALCREQLKLPKLEKPEEPEQFERNHAAIHEAEPGTCKPCDKVYAWRKL